MFTPNFGYRLQERGYRSANWELLETRDSAKTWSAKGTVTIPQVEGRFGSIHSEMWDVLYIDTSNIVLPLWFRFETDTSIFTAVYRTTDAGKSWTQKVPFGIEEQNLYNIYKGSRPGRFYLIGGPTLREVPEWTLPDYIWTEDYGDTWKADSLTNLRMHRLSNPAGDTLWALVGKWKGISHNLIQHAIDSIFFSSDNGQTWYRDGKTFAGDTILDMIWASPDTVFIPVYKDQGLTMYRGILNHSNAVAEGEPALDFHVTPNPATERITLSAKSGTVKIHDLIGRKIQEFNYDGRPIDVRSLPAGIYSLEFLSHGQTEWAKFLKQ